MSAAAASLGVEAKANLPFLEIYAEPPPFGRAFYELTNFGIVRRVLPLQLTTPAGLGYVRAPRFWIYNPIDGKLLQRVRLWMAPGVTQEQADLWIAPYKPREIRNLFEVSPIQYDYKNKRMRTFDNIVISPDLAGRLDEVIKVMNGLPYQGIWGIKTIDNERSIMVERGTKPSIILKPESRQLFGDLDQGFDKEQVEHTSAIVISMLASHFPALISFRRGSSQIPDDVLARAEAD